MKKNKFVNVISHEEEFSWNQAIDSLGTTLVGIFKKPDIINNIQEVPAATGVSGDDKKDMTPWLVGGGVALVLVVVLVVVLTRKK